MVLLFWQTASHFHFEVEGFANSIVCDCKNPFNFFRVNGQPIYFRKYFAQLGNAKQSTFFISGADTTAVLQCCMVQCHIWILTQQLLRYSITINNSPNLVIFDLGRKIIRKQKSANWHKVFSFIQQDYCIIQMVF